MPTNTTPTTHLDPGQAYHRALAANRDAWELHQLATGHSVRTSTGPVVPTEEAETKARNAYDASLRIIDHTLAGVLGDDRLVEGLTVYTDSGPLVVASTEKAQVHDHPAYPAGYVRTVVLTDDGRVVHRGQATAHTDSPVLFEVWESVLPCQAAAEAGSKAIWHKVRYGYCHPLDRKIIHEERTVFDTVDASEESED